MVGNVKSIFDTLLPLDLIFATASIVGVILLLPSARSRASIPSLDDLSISVFDVHELLSDTWPW